MNVQDFYQIFLTANDVTIDSRNVTKGDIFFAFSGRNFNGATQAQTACDQGARAVIVEDKSFENEARNIFYVPSTLEFLQQLAKHHRTQLNIPVIGLTGSNGKTTTKELIHAVMSQRFTTQFTKGNLNNHIGVPLTVLSIKPAHQLAVIEMGANHQKEIELLCSIAQPDIGYITNFGKAHLEGFGGFEGVIKGKSELYDYLRKANKCVLVNEADALQLEKSKGISKRISFGNKDSDYVFEPIRTEQFVGIQYDGQTAMSNLTGDYNFTNICAAVALGIYFNIDFDAIKTAIENYRPTNMRSQIMERNGKTLVLDTYNANPSSMAASLENFAHFEGSKTVIIGDMLELGAESTEEHQKILELASSKNFDRIITVGPIFQQARGTDSFAGTGELIQHLQNNKIASENILLKGSRGIALEKLIDYL